MSSRILSFLLSAALVLAVALTGLVVAFAIVAPLVGQPLETGFSVVCAGGQDVACAVERGPADTRLVLDRGDLVIVAPSLAATLLRVLDAALTGGFWIGLVWLLRRFARQVSLGRPFSSRVTRQLRWTAALLIAYPGWELIRSALWQTIVVLQQPDGGGLIHTFATPPSSGALRLLPEFSPGLALAGLLVLVVAQAFGIGAEVQRDSDEVV